MLSSPYVEGFADVTANLTILNDEKTQIEVNADLKNMSIDYSFLGFNKALNEEGKMSFLFWRLSLKMLKCVLNRFRISTLLQDELVLHHLFHQLIHSLHSFHSFHRC